MKKKSPPSTTHFNSKGEKIKTKPFSLVPKMLGRFQFENSKLTPTKLSNVNWFLGVGSNLKILD